MNDNIFGNLNSIDLILYARHQLFLIEVGLVLNPSFFHEGTIDNELFLLLGKNKNIPHEGTFNIALFPL